MKRIKKGLALSRETIRPLSVAILRNAAGGAQGTSGCTTNVRCLNSTNIQCPTFGSNCCLASVIMCVM